MRIKISNFTILLLIALACSSPVMAISYYLRADETVVNMPDGQQVTMWGFAQDSAFGAMDGTVSVPGPALTVPENDSSLTVYIDNNLDVPISMMVIGQNSYVLPVSFTDDQNRDRIRSFNYEAPAHNNIAYVYHWSDFRPGTYLYHSACHPVIQVQMGLYGSVTKDAVVENLGPAGMYNMLVFEDTYLSQSTIEGSAAIGASASLQNVSVASTLSGSDAKLVVGENIASYDEGSVGSASAGHLYVFGDANLNLVDYGKMITGDRSPLDISAANSYLLEASKFWGTLASNGTENLNGTVLTLTGTDNSTNVFSVTGTDFSNAVSLVFNIPLGSTALVNISGTNVQFSNLVTTLNNAQSSKIVYNFYEAVSLDISNSDPKGTVLAPKAETDFSDGMVGGSLIVKALGTSVTPSGGSAMNTLFDGVLPTVETKQAYYGVFYDSDVTLLFSEIDPVIHEAVATDNYGPDKAVKSCVDYEPQYFMINGHPYSALNKKIFAGKEGQRVLVRLLNIGFETHAPMISNSYMNVVAEDGYKYKYPREQYSMMLPPSKTKDVILTAQTAGSYKIYDRRLRLTTNNSLGGGMLRDLMITTDAANAVINLQDLIDQWLNQNCPECTADLSGDDDVDYIDFTMFAETYNN